ncbi:MAG: cupin domain-containing protein [Caulobacterales bacterium]
MIGAPQHHPSVETLTAFAAGTQRAGFDFVTAAHVNMCAQCQRHVAALEYVGGAGIAEGAAVEVDAHSLSHALNRLDIPPKAPQPAYSIEDILRKAKRRWVAPGIWVAKVETPHATEDRVYMLGAAPGAVTAKHTHEGPEFTHILSGALQDDGVIYRAGDFSERGSDHMHRPSAYGDEPCICLFATNGPLKAQDFISRLAFMVAGV